MSWPWRSQLNLFDELNERTNLSVAQREGASELLYKALETTVVPETIREVANTSIQKKMTLTIDDSLCAKAKPVMGFYPSYEDRIQYTKRLRVYLESQGLTILSERYPTISNALPDSYKTIFMDISWETPRVVLMEHLTDSLVESNTSSVNDDIVVEDLSNNLNKVIMNIEETSNNDTLQSDIVC
jgi:hypothetical protein